MAWPSGAAPIERVVVAARFREDAGVARQAGVMIKTDAEEFAKLAARLLTTHLETVKPD